MVDAAEKAEQVEKAVSLSLGGVDAALSLSLRSTSNTCSLGASTSGLWLCAPVVVVVATGAGVGMGVDPGAKVAPAPVRGSVSSGEASSSMGRSMGASIAAATTFEAIVVVVARGVGVFVAAVSSFGGATGE